MRKLARCKIYRFFGAKLKYELIEIYFTRLRTLGVDTGETFFWQLSGKFNCRDIFVKLIMKYCQIISLTNGKVTNQQFTLNLQNMPKIFGLFTKI